MQVKRRSLLTGAAAIAFMGAAAGLRPYGEDSEPAAADTRLPHPSRSGIDHIVVVMMENRSFDHFLGWLPRADGKQAGLTFRDRYGIAHKTYHLSHYASCGHTDPNHSYLGGRVELDHGHDDGWLRTGSNDLLSIGYYTKSDLAFFATAAPAFTACDRYFSAVMAPTYPNRLYQHSAQTDRLHNSVDLATMPTIWDRLADAGLKGRYYFSDVPFTVLWHDKYRSISRDFKEFLTDAAAGTLPEVSFVDPRFEDEPTGPASDDHPPTDIRTGEQFLAQVYTAVTSGPQWAHTLLVVNYDEWGGFFDHVTPGFAPDVSPATRLRGFRVPALVISPRSQQGRVAHDVYDHTSVLKAIEWRWGLDPLTPRDAAARNIAEVLDWDGPVRMKPPAITVPPFTPAGPCGSGSSGLASTEPGSTDLRALARTLGWRLP